MGNCVTTGDQIVLISFSDSYADEDKSGIRVAQYLTELPLKEVLLRQLQKSLEAARENMPIENENNNQNHGIYT
jgi:hypothetical protein